MVSSIRLSRELLRVREYWIFAALFGQISFVGAQRKAEAEVQILQIVLQVLHFRVMPEPYRLRLPL